ncbi:SIMPL domain-containing protein [Flagellimonas sp. DF-77]|uniref:SIMPL domain-containing protein n=1 Tax=Flagellimonas algarum TaxID=3230298 RepID=UPI003396DF45
MKHYVPLLILMLLGTFGWTQTKSFLDLPYLETSAKVDTLVTPDEIYLSITIREKDSKGRKSVEEQEQRMAGKLKELGIDVKQDLKIKNLTSYYKSYFLRSKDVLKSKQFSLKVADGLTAGKVMAALEEIGIANTYLERTAYSDMDGLELLLKSRAVAKAKAKAIALTKPLGQKIGRAIHIVDNSQPYYPNYGQPRMAMMSKMEMDAEAAPLDIGFEKIKIEATVNIKFSLYNE